MYLSNGSIFEDKLVEVLNHELGTHYLRAYNESRQLWRNNRSDFGMTSYIATEEGLAVLNELYEPT